MTSSEPITVLAASVVSARVKDLPDIKMMVPDWSKTDRSTPLSDVPKVERLRRPSTSEIAVEGMFLQTWGSTALGFGGIGGASMTDAYTIVVSRQGFDYAVYFNGRLAYVISKPNAQFFLDLHARSMVSVSQAGKYRREVKGDA